MAVSELKASLEKFNNEMLEIKENQKKLQEYCVEIQPMKSSSVLPVHESADTCLMSIFFTCKWKPRKYTGRLTNYKTKPTDGRAVPKAQCYIICCSKAGSSS